MKVNSIKTYLLFSLPVIFLLLFILCFFLSSLFLFLQGNELMKESSLFSYQYFEKDYLRKEISFGIVSIFDEIDQFVSYDDYELQKSVLISSFGTEEFECFGSCYCENDNFRRISHSRVLIEGISYFLAAISSVVAFNVAKEYFSEKCSEKYSNICESKSIKSEVGNCEVVSKFYTGDEHIKLYEDPEKVEKRVYICYGNCVDKLRRTGSKTPKAKEEGFDCKQLKREAEMIVYSNELSWKTPKQKLPSKMQYTAKAKFQQNHLVSFCRENSRIEYEFQATQSYHSKKSGGKIKKYKYTNKRIGSMCTGIRGNSGHSNFQNVECRQIDPKPTDNASEYWDKRWWEKKKKWDEL